MASTTSEMPMEIDFDNCRKSDEHCHNGSRFETISLIVHVELGPVRVSILKAEGPVQQRCNI